MKKLIALPALAIALVAGCGGSKGTDPAIVRSFADYIKALNAHDGAKVCQLLVPTSIDKLRPPAQRETCAEAVTASIGHTGSGGLKWVSAKVVGTPKAEGNDRTATLRATVENSYSASLTIKNLNGGTAQSQPSKLTLGKEDESVKMQLTDGKWLLAEPDLTLYHAIGQK